MSSHRLVSCDDHLAVGLRSGPETASYYSSQSMFAFQSTSNLGLMAESKKLTQWVSCMKHLQFNHLLTKFNYRRTFRWRFLEIDRGSIVIICYSSFTWLAPKMTIPSLLHWQWLKYIDVWTINSQHPSPPKRFEKLTSSFPKSKSPAYPGISTPTQFV